MSLPKAARQKTPELRTFLSLGFLTETEVITSRLESHGKDCRGRDTWCSGRRDVLK